MATTRIPAAFADYVPSWSPRRRHSGGIDPSRRSCLDVDLGSGLAVGHLLRGQHRTEIRARSASCRTRSNKDRLGHEARPRASALRSARRPPGSFNQREITTLKRLHPRCHLFGIRSGECGYAKVVVQISGSFDGTHAHPVRSAPSCHRPPCFLTKVLHARWLTAHRTEQHTDEVDDNGLDHLEAPFRTCRICRAISTSSLQFLIGDGGDLQCLLLCPILIQ